MGGAGKAVYPVFYGGDGRDFIAKMPGKPQMHPRLVAQFYRWLCWKSGGAFYRPVLGFPAGIRVIIKDINILDSVTLGPPRKLVPTVL